MTVDQLNERLRLGLASEKEAIYFCRAWNESGKHFLQARYLGGKVLLFSEDHGYRTAPQTWNRSADA